MTKQEKAHASDGLHDYSVHMRAVVTRDVEIRAASPEEAVRLVVERWVQWGEYYEIEFDTEAMTARVLAKGEAAREKGLPVSDAMPVRPVNGVERIAAERQRQIEAEGYDADHDDAINARIYAAALIAAEIDRLLRLTPEGEPQGEESGT